MVLDLTVNANRTSAPKQSPINALVYSTLTKISPTQPIKEKKTRTGHGRETTTTSRYACRAPLSQRHHHVLHVGKDSDRKLHLVTNHAVSFKPHSLDSDKLQLITTLSKPKTDKANLHHPEHMQSSHMAQLTITEAEKLIKQMQVATNENHITEQSGAA